MNRPVLNVYMLPWHLERSDAFRELLLVPAADAFDCRVMAWDGAGSPPGLDSALDSGVRHFAFCQMRPPDLAGRGVRVAWLPMWDQYRNESARFWEAVPDDVGIISFSEEVSRRAAESGKEFLDVRYFPDPGGLPRASSERKLFYWNRVGLMGPRLLARLCEELDLDELVFRDQLDPHALPSARYVPDPQEMGCKVTITDGFLERDAYLELVSQCGVFVAPRECEGVGLAYLEAMAMGAAVIALDAPAMNETIVHGVNGWLLKPRSFRQRLREAAAVRAGRSPGPFLADDRQSLGWLGLTDPLELGANARLMAKDGHDRWKASWPAIARFIHGTVG